jgi:hypothetical protein
MAGTKARMLRGLLSARQLVNDSFEAVERVLVRGRASSDQDADEDGEFDEILAENCQPVGLVARPAENADVAAIVGNIGGDGTNPYILGTVDGTRASVIDERGVGTTLDFVIAYNSTDVLEIRGGKIRALSLSGSAASVALTSDANNLNARIAALESALNTLIVLYNTHLHVISGVPPVTAPTTNQATLASTSANVVGTQRFEAE